MLQVTFREMADEHPDADAGDVIFVLKQQACSPADSALPDHVDDAGILVHCSCQEHADFKRKGADLYVERKISLVEAGSWLLIWCLVRHLR